MHPDSSETLLSTGDRSANSLTERLSAIHGVIRARYPDVDRVALAIYDKATDLLKTFVSSNHDHHALIGYQARLSDVPSLAQLAKARQNRLISNIGDRFDSPTEHTDWLKKQSYHSSFTVPIYNGEDLAAFLFFDSKTPDAFDVAAAEFLTVFADLIAHLYLSEVRAVRNLISTVHIAAGLARIRDMETGEHLERIASYARLMGQKLASSHQLSDEFIEYLHLFSSLHDIGKVGIPDSILLKPGKLTESEYAIMKQHVTIGETMIDQIVADMGLNEDLASRIMRNIVAGHHERGDGSGYPRGLFMANIPIEARIVAVADVYDALSNERPYKPAWEEARVVALLRDEAAGGRLDPDCVDALLNAKEEREAIRKRFSEAAHQYTPPEKHATRSAA
ncbi:HD domain-containing protein [Burkholderiaceae bacterium DAT-1]|nr:HD domain-containing protein [Burkholderiaceae bacterium DAT-1]